MAWPRGELESPLEVDVIVPSTGNDEAVTLVEANGTVQPKCVKPNGQAGFPSGLELSSQEF